MPIDDYVHLCIWHPIILAVDAHKVLACLLSSPLKPKPLCHSMLLHTLLHLHSYFLSLAAARNTPPLREPNHTAYSILSVSPPVSLAVRVVYT